MSTDINRRILQNLDCANCDDSTKEFLREIFFLEYKHSEEKVWQYSKEYDSSLKRHLKQNLTERGDIYDI